MRHTVGELILSIYFATSRSEQLQARQILRIDNAYWHVVVINHDQIVDAMTLQQVQNFHREFFFMHRDWIQRHQVCHESFANPGIRLKMAHEISVGEYAE